MYRKILQNFLLLFIICGVESATYGQRYGESTVYPNIQGFSNNYQSSISPYLNQNRANYANDLAVFPGSTRYPNYSPEYSTNGYNSYSSYSTPKNGLYGSTYGSNYGSGYGSSYGSGYGSSHGSGYGSSNGYQNSYNTPGYGSTGYGSGYGGRSYSSYEMPFMKDGGYCQNRGPQTGIWVDSLMGMWYGVEFVQHLAGDSRVDYMRTCIVIHISEPRDTPYTENQPFHVQHINAKFRQEYRHLRLLWDEAGHTNEYSLYFRNDSAGFWQVYGRQNGTIPDRSSYQQFSGTIQVLKAVNDHLLLNFCQEAKLNSPAQLYSVLFSRDPGTLSRWEIESVHSLLQNKKLSVASRRMVCGNSAGRAVYSLVLSVFLFALTVTGRSS